MVRAESGAESVSMGHHTTPNCHAKCSQAAEQLRRRSVIAIPSATDPNPWELQLCRRPESAVRPSAQPPSAPPPSASSYTQPPRRRRRQDYHQSRDRRRCPVAASCSPCRCSPSPCSPPSCSPSSCSAVNATTLTRRRHLRHTCIHARAICVSAARESFSVSLCAGRSALVFIHATRLL